MLNLIKSEFRKIYTSKSLIVFLAIPVALAFLSIASERLIFEVINAVSTSDTEVVYSTEIGYTFLSSVTQNSFLVVLSVFLAVWNVRDYSTGTIKIMLARGCSRSNIYFAKYLVSMVTVVMYTVVNTIFYVLFSFMFSKVTGTLTVEVFGMYMLDVFMIIAISTAYFSIIMMFQKLAPSIIINLVSGSAVSIVLTVIQEALIKSDKYNINTLSLETIMQRLPVKAISEEQASNSGSITQLIAQLSEQITRPFEVNSTFILHMNIICVLYIAVFLLIGFAVIRRKEY